MIFLSITFDSNQVKTMCVYVLCMCVYVLCMCVCVYVCACVCACVVYVCMCVLGKAFIAYPFSNI